MGSSFCSCLVGGQTGMQAGMYMHAHACSAPCDHAFAVQWTGAALLQL
jgi:hypothetical protein